MIIDTNASERIKRYRGLSYTKPIDAAKEAVRVIDLADRLAGPGKMRRVGKTWVTNCLLPNHEDRTPSFVVYPETDSWYCFACLRGGDVVELARLAWGYDERDAHVAAADLLHEFGHELPPRPPAWFRRQERQRPMRDAIENARVEVLMRRLWRWVFEPVLADLEDADERERVGDELWAKAVLLARRLVEERGGNS
jgi:hypothetical protein